MLYRQETDWTTGNLVRDVSPPAKSGGSHTAFSVGDIPQGTWVNYHFDHSAERLYAVVLVGREATMLADEQVEVEGIRTRCR